MIWIFGIYIVIGILETISRYTNPDPSLKPAWMSLERNPIKIIFGMAIHVILWPLIVFLK